MTILINDSASIEALCQRAAAANAPQLPLFRAAADRRLLLAMLMHPTVIWPRKLAKCRMPIVAVIGDDPWPGRVSVGPAEWHCAKRAKEWAQHGLVVVHGTWAHLDHYRGAVHAAQHYRRILFVESDSAHADAWATFFGSQVMRFDVPPGCVHPSPGRETIH